MAPDLDVLKRVLVSMRHAEIFISSREKMHPDGRTLYREDMNDLSELVKRLTKEETADAENSRRSG